MDEFTCIRDSTVKKTCIYKKVNKNRIKMKPFYFDEQTNNVS